MFEHVMTLFNPRQPPVLVCDATVSAFCTHGQATSLFMLRLEYSLRSVAYPVWTQAVNKLWGADFRRAIFATQSVYMYYASDPFRQPWGVDYV